MGSVRLTSPKIRHKVPLRDHLLPRVSPWLMSWFLRYVPFYTRRHLHAVRIAGEEHIRAVGAKPLIVYMNHPGWWDPMIAAILAREYFPVRTHYAPIDAAALRKYAFFARLGFFGVDDSFHGSRRFLQIAEQVLLRSNAALWITAQGKFCDVRRRPVILASGLAHLASRMDGITILPVAVEYVFWEERTPEALVRVGAPLVAGSVASKASWQNRLQAQLTTIMDELAEDALNRRDSAFRTIVSGRSGVGGFYDLWRRSRAALRGQHFSPSHGND